MTWILSRIYQDNRKRLYRSTSSLYPEHYSVKKKIWVLKHHRRLCSLIFLLSFFAAFSIFIVIHLASVQNDNNSNNYMIQSFCRRYSKLCFNETVAKGQNPNDNPSINNVRPKLEHQALSYPVSHIEYDTIIHNETWAHHSVHGVLYMAVKNEDLQQVRESMRSLEDRFNHRWHYPWVLLSSERLTEDFTKYTSSISSGPIYYGKMDPEAFSYPSWIDLDKIKKSMENSDTEQDLSVLQLKRYQSGLFYHHALFQNVKYIWRIEPGVTFSCRMTDDDDDPFEKMVRNNKTYGIAVTRRYQEQKATEDIWKITKNYINKNIHTPYQARAEDQTVMQAMVDHHGYNSCHFWSLFEIMDIEFLKSAQHQHFFAYMDHQGTFFYKKLTDSVYRTMAVAMFLNSDQIEFFNEIGLKKDGFVSHCPLNIEQMNKCACDTHGNDVFDVGSCSIRFLRYINPLSITNTAKFVMSKMENK